MDFHHHPPVFDRTAWGLACGFLLFAAGITPLAAEPGAREAHELRLEQLRQEHAARRRELEAERQRRRAEREAERAVRRELFEKDREAWWRAYEARREAIQERIQDDRRRFLEERRERIKARTADESLQPGGDQQASREGDGQS